MKKTSLGQVIGIIYILVGILVFASPFIVGLAVVLFIGCGFYLQAG